MRRVLVGLVLTLVLAAPAAAAQNPLELVGTEQLSPRLSELTFTTPAVAAPTRVRVLLPEGYDPATRYPVIYLLHGALDDQSSWTVKGDAEAITAPYPVIVVMPDTGTGGGYTDWYNGGAFGPPAWETYHVGQLVPWIDAHYPTIAKRSGRALIGLSMGGYGAMHYAARHPDRFVAAAGFSPAVDLNNVFMRALGEAEDAADGPPSPYGSYATEEVRFRGHNPTDLAANLDGLELVIKTGNGMPGGPGGDTGDPVEADVHEQAIVFHDALTAAGIPHLFEDYGAGGHAWYYWMRDLRETLPLFMQTFADPPKRPRTLHHASIDPDYRVYGWRVRIDRPVLEFSVLDASPDGFTLSGSGSGVVRTARVTKPGNEVLVTIGGETTELTADRRGRIRVPVTLGPGNTAQQYSPQAKTTDPTQVHTVEASFG